MIKWIISDLDGTLLGYSPDQGIIVDPNTINMLNNLLKTNQYKLTIATGRHFTNVESMMNTFNLDYPQDAYIIGMNGAQIYSCKDRKLIQNIHIDNKLLSQFVKAVEYFEQNYKDKYFIIGYQDGFYNMFFYDSKSDFFRENMAEIRRYEDREKSLNPTVITNFNQVKDVYKIIFSIEIMDNYEEIATVLKKLLPDMNFARSSDRFIEVFPKTVNKAIALDYLNKHIYKFKKNEMLGFGDSFNDYEMLEYVGTSVTKIKAHEEIKKICDYVIDADSSTFVGDALDLLVCK